ncbi:VirB8/TrbF family protein [Lyticum sinuosum]|uniref:Type IV secretion system protein VirB8 n=1 Tax=Lyticum sinuosum TaxID=1332059 RepID=A0AAE4VKS6_9RICK|nr:VirB8/TrbF family protein [Lyticum sinuosum]MDZ5761099.1 Type IV secretion system protein VirB8 [Lyticum sinuosum]
MRNDNNEYYHLISQKLEDGSYFSDAQKWFAQKYLFVYTQHIFSVILVIVFMINSALIIIASQMNYEVKKIPFSIYAIDPITKFPRISALSDKDEDMVVSVARYLISYYTKLREEYNPIISTDSSSYNTYLNKVQKLSSRQVYNDFLNFIAPNSNPESPVLQYRDIITRKIRIKKVEFLPYLFKPDRAIIYYFTENTLNNQIVDRNEFQVEILFDISIKSKMHQVEMSILRYQYIKD